MLGVIAVVFIVVVVIFIVIVALSVVAVVVTAVGRSLKMQIKQKQPFEVNTPVSRFRAVFAWNRFFSSG